MNAVKLQQLSLFAERLPSKPYCSDDLDRGLLIRPKSTAIQKKYIQHNGPTHKYYMAFDIDRPEAAVDWMDRNAPAPNLVMTNPRNGHAHLIYGLEVSVRTAYDGRAEPLRFAAAVEIGLRAKLEADISYCGLMVKNPFSEAWRVQTVNDRLYDLHGLSEWVDLGTRDSRKKFENYGLGRNVNLFDGLRGWAYKAIRQGWPSYPQWLEACESRAAGLNLKFEKPLERVECRHVAKSVAKWTYKHFDAARFSAWQAVQGRKGGIAKGQAYADKAAAACRMRAEGLTQAAIAAHLGVHVNSVARWLKSETHK